VSAWKTGAWKTGAWKGTAWATNEEPSAPSAGNYVQRVVSRSVVFPLADIEELRRKARQRREEDEIIIL
jgi:hypothetical protein